MKNLFLFDQSVFNRLISASGSDIEFTKIFEESMVKNRLIQNSSHFKVQTTVLLVLELLGVHPEFIIPIQDHKSYINEKIQGVENVEEIKEIVLSYFLKIIEEKSNFTVEYFHSKIDEKIEKYSSHNGRKFLRAIKTDFLPHDESGLKKILLALGHDRVYAFPYSSNISTKMAFSFMLDIIKTLGAGLDYNQARAIRTIVHNLLIPSNLETILQKTSADEKELNKLIHQIKFFKENSDLGDAEIVNYCSVGMVRNNRLTPVTCFTTDNENYTLNRIKIFKEINTFIFQFIGQEKKGLPVFSEGIVEPIFGRIVFVSKNGDIQNIYDVKDVD